MASESTKQVEQPEISQLNENDIDNILDEIERREETKQNYNNINWPQIQQEIRVKNINLIKTLITSKEIHVNSQNPVDGKTLLIYGVIIGDVNLVTTICNFGADCKIKDKHNLDALDYAVKYGRYKITEIVYYQQLSGSLGKDLKDITKEIRIKNKEAKYIYESGNGLHDFLIYFMMKAIKARAPFDGAMLYYSWYFVLNKSETEKTNPFHHDLWKAMMSVYEEILSNTSDTEGWKWLKETFVPSVIWYLPHPNNRKINDSKMEDNEDKPEEMEHVLQTTLFYELLQSVRCESKKQSDLLLKEKIDKIKNEKPNEWNELISYNVNTKFSSNARQDLCGCLEPRYTEKDLNEDRYPPSTHFCAKRHYDTNIYLNELLFQANIIDTLFQDEMKNITKEINKEINGDVAYRAGPVKTLSRSQTKVENDYINEDYPTSAKILDINRCALQFKTIQEMMKYIEIFTDKIKTSKAGCITEIIRCKNGWSVYNEQQPQYTDVKLNVLVKSKHDGMVIAEIQFLLELMSSFKKKAHKLYSIERKFELVYNYGLLTQKMAKFQDLNDMNSTLNELAIKDDVKFFVDLWENSTPNVTLLMDIKSETKIYDNAVVNILMSKTGEIHNYLTSDFRAIYREMISFYINNVIGSWHVFLNNLTSDLSLKLQFLQKLINLFDQNKKVTDFDNALQILQSFGVIYDLLDHNVSSFVVQHKAFNFCTLKTPIYSECDGFDDHKHTEFKFVNDSFGGGSLYMFGNNNDGRLGFGDDYKEKTCPTPSICATFNNYNLLQIASFDKHCLALDINGSVWSWGKNDKGQLGTGEKGGFKNTPYLIPSFCQYKAINIAVGSGNSLILTENGQIWSIGKGQLTPKLMEELKDEYINHISCGWGHNCAISENGKLYTWGLHNYGQCGVGDGRGIKIKVPTEVDSLNGLIPQYTACGRCHVLLLTTNGAIWSFGTNKWGQLGHKEEHNQKSPKLIEMFLSKRIIDISCGKDYSLCVTENGELYFWGDLQRKIVKTPRKMDYFQDKKIKVISCEGGGNHSAVITTDGLYMFGDGKNGELGQGNLDDKESKYTPIKVEYFKQHDIASVALGDGYSAIITQKNKHIDDEKKMDDGENVYKLKPNQQIYFKNKMQDNLKTNSFKIYMKNAKLFKNEDWFLMAQNKHYFTLNTTFIDNLQIDDNECIELKDNKMIHKMYHCQILQSKYILLINENKEEIKEEFVDKDKIYTFNDIENIKFKIPKLNEIDSGELNICIYVQPSKTDQFVLLKQLKYIKQ